MTELISSLSDSERAEEMSVAEADQLATCEAVVDQGLGVFVEVGTALMTIRDQRLYRTTHGTFESYVQDRFAIRAAHSYRLIDAARVAMSPIGDKIINEAQARELTPYLDDLKRMKAIVTRANKGNGPLTAEKLRQAAYEIRGGGKVFTPEVVEVDPTEAVVETGGAVTEWSERVQAVSAEVPMEDLTTEQVLWLQGAADFLRDYCQGELIRRKEA